jgi:hypothetical protein
MKQDQRFLHYYFLCSLVTDFFAFLIDNGLWTKSLELHKISQMFTMLQQAIIAMSIGNISSNSIIRDLNATFNYF